MAKGRTPKSGPAPSLELSTGYEPAEFLTIDLDVRSRYSLKALFEAWPWADRPIRMNGRPDPKWLVVRPRGIARTPEKAAQLLLQEVDRLPPAARRSWKRATRRIFDIGIQAGVDRRAFELQIEATMLARIAAAGGELQVTIYAPVPAQATTP
jgi:hypothetical protein